MDFEADIGLEVHAELKTRSKMFYACPVLDITKTEPNSAVCPVCSGMPGSLPVVNRRAVELGLKAALALECTILERSIFARKNYFYPNLPKGYQISQYEKPLARNGRLVLRIEPNISVRPFGSQVFGTRTEIKNLNSFRALERSIAFEIERQSELLRQGEHIWQETRGWDDVHGCTIIQRVKEEADDYRYFPEPDLPPLVITNEWQDEVLSNLPELPQSRRRRFLDQYKLTEQDVAVLIDEPAVAEFFEKAVEAGNDVPPRVVSNWITGELFALLNDSNLVIEQCSISLSSLVELLSMLRRGQVNQTSAKAVLAEMFETGQSPGEIVPRRGLHQITDQAVIENLVEQVLSEFPAQVRAYNSGKPAIARWLFGEIMHRAGGRTNPQIVERLLNEQLAAPRAFQDQSNRLDVN